MIFTLIAATLMQAVPAPTPATRPADARPTDPQAFVAEIAKAHHAETYYARPAVKADLHVEFGGNVRVDGPVWYLPPAHVTRTETGGKTIVFDGTTCYVSPASETKPTDRFTALTWPYFLSAPFKFQDGGVNLADGGMQRLDGEPRPTVKMTFDPGTGDAPDDWYYIWKNDDGTLAAIAYVVTYFPGQDPKPHVAVYEDYDTVDGVKLPKKITFYNWSPKDGMTGDAIGTVEVRSYEFAEPPAGAFDKPDDAAEVPLPSAE